MEKKGLSKQVYRNLNPGETYQSYVPHTEVQNELSVRAIGLGIILAVIFGAANAYLALKIGMTVSASIPAAVISMGILRGWFKNVQILENNTVQTIGSAGESLAAGVTFTLPALLIMGIRPHLFHIFLMALIGGWLGVLFMIPLRKFLIVKEHGKLPYPEGIACAEIIVAGEEGGSGSWIIIKALIFGGIYKFMSGALKLFSEEPEQEIHSLKTSLGFNSIPALLGVGFIVGPRIACYMLSGGVLGWFVIIPLIHLFGDGLTTSVFPITDGTLIKNMGHWAVWKYYIKPIGAGAVAFGGIVSLFNSIPTIISAFKEGIKGLKSSPDKNTNTKKELRTSQDIPMKWVMFGIILLIIVIWILPDIPGSFIKFPGSLFTRFITVLIIAISSFFFVTVSSRIVGMVGSSNNPASGMTIATLLIASGILYMLGFRGTDGIIAAISVGVFVCIAVCIAGDTSQDLKTGYILGATPKKQQIGELIGVLAAAICIGLVIIHLCTVYQIGSKDLPAPQATLMATLVNGVMTHTLPWGFVFAGAACALVVELLGINSLCFAIGLYLPMSLSTPILIGALIKWYVEKDSNGNKEIASKRNEQGILAASGLIAGEAFVGILLAVCASIPIAGKPLTFHLANLVGNLPSIKNINANFWLSLLPFVVMCYFLVRMTEIKEKD